MGSDWIWREPDKLKEHDQIHSHAHEVPLVMTLMPIGLNSVQGLLAWPSRSTPGAQLGADAGQIQRSKLRFGYDRALNVFSVAPG